MSYELIAALMFSSMLLMLLTGQRVFGAIGFVATVASLAGTGTARQHAVFGGDPAFTGSFPPGRHAVFDIGST